MDEKRSYWEEKLGSAITAELFSELDGAAAPDDASMHVYLSSGQVEEIRPASSVNLTSDRIEIMYKDHAVASYLRSAVWSASKGNISPSFG